MIVKRENQMENIAAPKGLKRGRNTVSRMTLRILIGLILVMVAVTPCFADITDIGENAGGWIQEQAFYIGMAIVAVIMVVFIMKKAWIPAVIFIIIAGILLAIIGSPETLQSFGQSLLNRFTQ